MNQVAIALASAFMLVVACANGPQFVGQPASGGAEDISKLYVTTGESGDPGLAQDRSSLGGKILRINPDGSIPPAWSFGHCNIQGAAWDSAGRLWVTEYGANRLDELNLIQRGCNYGWPMTEGRADTPGLMDPVIQWPVGEASRPGLAYVGGSLWVACLRGQRLYRVLQFRA